MTAKEKFLQIESYEEFDRRREEFKDLKMDKDILHHASKHIFQKGSLKQGLSKTPGQPIGR